MMKSMDYKTINNEVISEQEITKSKFICYLTPINSEEEAKEYIRSIKKQHPKAAHHCSAYIVGEIERSNDDGEPASSAGLPMLQVLRGNQLQNIAAVVVRYFGGVKLGVGGLIRAYGSSVSLAITNATLLTPQYVSTVVLKFPYEYINIVETHCNEIATIVNREYESLVIYVIDIKDMEQLDDLHDLTKGSIDLEVCSQRIDYVKEVQDGT